MERTEIRHSHDIIVDILSARAILRQAAVTGCNLDQVVGHLAQVRSPISRASYTYYAPYNVFAVDFGAGRTRSQPPLSGSRSDR